MCISHIKWYLSTVYKYIHNRKCRIYFRMCPQANAQYMYLSIKYVYKIDAFLIRIFFNKGIRYTLKNLPCPSFAAGFESRIIGLSSWSVCFTGECGVGILSALSHNGWWWRFNGDFWKEYGFMQLAIWVCRTGLLIEGNNMKIIDDNPYSSWIR